MAKQTGLGDNFYLGGYDLSGVATAFNRIGGGPAALDVTPVNKSAHERLGGLRDGELSVTSLFDDGSAADRANAAGSPFVGISTLPTTDTQAMYTRGTAIGSAAACLVCKQVGLDTDRQANGMLVFNAQCLANGYGLEWGELLTAGKRTDTEATNGASLNAGEASSFGLQAYLQVFDFDGTDVTVKLQQSSDDGSGDAFADVTGGGFTQITTGNQTQRIATATDQAVEQYLRAVTTTSGGVTSVEFAVAVVRNDAAPEF